MILMQVANEPNKENPGVKRTDQNFGVIGHFCGEHAWQAARMKTFELTVNEGGLMVSLRKETGRRKRLQNRRE